MIEFPCFFISYFQVQISPLNLSPFPKVHLPEDCAESLATVVSSSVIAQTPPLPACCCSCTFSAFPFKVAKASSYHISSWPFSCFPHCVCVCIPSFSFWESGWKTQTIVISHVCKLSCDIVKTWFFFWSEACIFFLLYLLWSTDSDSKCSWMTC